MTPSSRPPYPNLTPEALVPLTARMPERLVGMGFRCWLRGLATGDIGFWETAFSAFCQQMSPQEAKSQLIALSQFVRAVSENTERNIEVGEPSACGFCRDECLAISIIAACQHGSRPALQASATALVGCDDIGDTIASAQTFAHSMKSADLLLALESVCPATCALKVQYRRPM